MATWTLVALALTPIGPYFRELAFESNVYADTPIVKVDQSIPELSIETLYRPGKTFSYVSPSAPPLRWVRGDRGESVLLIKRDKAWMQRDLQSQIETPFAPAIQFLAAAKWLGTQDWVDAKRIAVRGWSFGGYLTLQAMTHSDVFAAGIAGGSVADWRGYDAVYTERYMGLPSQNTARYDATSPTKAAEGLKGHLLLIHGELDDNVHLENALRFARAAQRHAKGFDMMIYPGAMHGVSSSDQNYHLVKMSYEFLMRELTLKSD